MTDLLVEVRGATTGDTEDDLRSLLRWLHEDENLAGGVRGRVVAGGPPVPGHMGTGFDLLELAVGSGLSIASLVVSVRQWRASRRDAPAVVLRRGEVEVRLTAEAAHDDEALRRLAGLLDQRPDQSSTPAAETGNDGGPA